MQINIIHNADTNLYTTVMYIFHVASIYIETVFLGNDSSARSFFPVFFVSFWWGPFGTRCAGTRPQKNCITHVGFDSALSRTLFVFFFLPPNRTRLITTVFVNPIYRTPVPTVGKLPGGTKVPEETRMRSPRIKGNR